MDKETLIKRLAFENPSMNNDVDFMKWLQLNYGHDKAYSEFLRLLEEMNIPRDTFIWP